MRLSRRLRGAPRHDLAVATLRRIGLNALFLVPGETGGMETYARRLVPALAGAAPELELVAFVGRDAVARLGVPADRVDAIHSAGGLPPGPATPEEELRRRYSLGEAPIVLSVSARRPHKNIVRLLEAFACVRPEPRPLLVLPGYRTAF